METVKQRLIFWTERQKGVCVPAAHACELARLYRYLVLLPGYQVRVSYMQHFWKLIINFYPIRYIRKALSVPLYCDEELPAEQIKPHH